MDPVEVWLSFWKWFSNTGCQIRIFLRDSNGSPMLHKWGVHKEFEGFMPFNSVLSPHCHQCLKLSQKSCRSSCLESEIIDIKLKKNEQKISRIPPKLSALDRRTCGNFQHWFSWGGTDPQMYIKWELAEKNRVYGLPIPTYLTARKHNHVIY